MRFSHTPRPKNLISLTPLIDVVFILLVFFMLASSFADWRGLDLALPTPLTTEASLDAALLVEVEAEALSIDGQILDEDQYRAALATLLRETPERRVVLRPVNGASLQRLVAVLDASTAAGVSGVALAGPQGE